MAGVLLGHLGEQLSHKLDLYDQILKSPINFILRTNLALSKNLTPFYFPFQLVNQHNPQHYHSRNYYLIQNLS